MTFEYNGSKVFQPYQETVERKNVGTIKSQLSPRILILIMNKVKQTLKPKGDTGRITRKHL